MTFQFCLFDPEKLYTLRGCREVVGCMMEREKQCLLLKRDFAILALLGL